MPNDCRDEKVNGWVRPVICPRLIPEYTGQVQQPVADVEREAGAEPLHQARVV